LSAETEEKVDRMIAIELPIVEVTLMEDRARILRRGTIQARSGQHSYTLSQVSPVLADKSLLAKVHNAPKGTQVLDTSVHRRVRVVRDQKPHEIAKLEAAIEAKETEHRKLQRKQEQHQEQLIQLQRLIAVSYKEFTREVQWDVSLMATWKDQLRFLRQSEIDETKAIFDIQETQKTLNEEIQRLWQEVRLKNTPNSFKESDLSLVLITAKDCEVEITVEYLVPGACWRPYHTAELLDDQVQWTCDGCVWQNTGEDWNNVALCFSTQRPSLGAEPPELQSEVLQVQRKPKTMVVETRQETIQTTGLGQDKKVASELPGIDDGGEVRNLHSLAPATIPSDGKPWRVKLFEFTSKAEVELTCIPELNPCVLLKSSQSNSGNLPLLAGPVDLIKNRGFVGRTKVLYVAPAEKFELGWGPDPNLRVFRMVVPMPAETKMMSSWVTQTTMIRLQFSNLSAKKQELHVRERVPVSEIEKVKIEMEAKVPSTPNPPNKDGISSWRVELEPFEHEYLEFYVRVRKHNDVVGV
jgi:uncharacterized protein (TIGR02231 family)